MSPDVLNTVVQGGALGLLALVLFWVFKSQHEANKLQHQANSRMLEMIEAQLETIKANTATQQKMIDTLDHHDKRSLERHQELLAARDYAHSNRKVRRVAPAAGGS